MDNTKCPICHNEADSSRGRGRGTSRYSCRTCGQYTITASARDDTIHQWWNKQDTVSLAKLSAFVKAWTLRHPEGISLRTEHEKPKALPNPVFTLEEALNAFPRTVSERIDRALLNLALKAPKLYTPISLHPHADYPIFYALDGDEQKYMIEIFKERRYLNERLLTAGNVVVSLTAHGWQRIDELQRGTAENPRQGFVAMWFDDSMQDARKRGFVAAIDEAGYDPKIIDDREDFNGDIHDEIIAEIRKSRFVVADFTGNRPNVYYEAGFAEALGKPVIYTCHKDHLDEKKNFDIRQRNHILWEESDELRKRLYRRIEATIGLPA